jgi:heat shock protein beta
MVDGKCQFTCNSNSSYEVLYLVSDQNYVTGLENGGKPTGLKDIKKVTVNSDGTTALSEGSDGIPDIIQEKTCDEIRSICSDIDGDKLPDCLEMPVPNTCYTGTFSAAGGTKYLNPFVADTDGDDISDGIDSDPFGTGGEADIKLFLNAKTIAVCADRDNDGLYDIQEDVDLNGEGIGKTKTDPLKADTDSDGLNDKIEKFTSMTDPLLEDSDGDNLPDGAEIASGDPQVYNFEVQGSVIGCKPGIQLANYTQFYGDTNPQAGVGYDTDGDGLPDGVEVMLGTNPNNPDSDGDKKKDGEEKLFWDSAEIAYNESDPCSTDTDDDGIKDNVDKCPNNPDVSCDHISEWGPDDDNDGLPNSFEEMMNTDPKNDDSDNDGLVDGCDKNGDGELCWHVKHNDFKSTAINTDEGETDPRPCPNGENNSQDGFTLSSEFTEGEGVTSFCGATICVACGSDTDGDCLPDYFERKFNTLGGNSDTDNDQIPDGIEAGWVVAKEVGGIGSGKFILVKGSTKTKYQDNGTQTDPANADTDGDGVLCDGNCGPRSFEDYNCNGKVDIDVSLTPKEIDPRLIDSDGDGIPDPTELCNENGCGVMNMGRAVSFDRGGCSGSIGGASGETWGMTIMFAVMLGATRVASFVMRKTRKSKARG